MRRGPDAGLNSLVTATGGPHISSRPVNAASPRATVASPVSPGKKSRGGIHTAKFRCAGVKKDGTRCTRTVTIECPVPYQMDTPTCSVAGSDVCVVSDSSDSDCDTGINGEEGDESLGLTSPERREFCFQHVNEINRASGFALPDGSLFTFSDYFVTSPSEAADTTTDGCPTPAVVGAVTAAKLRAVLTRPVREADAASEGFLYCFRLKDQGGGKVLLKVGRAAQVYKRIAQWRDQCRSHEPLLVGLYPGGPAAAGAGSALPGLGALGRDVRGVRLTHLCELLVHTELDEYAQRLRAPCADCGRAHRELFAFELPSRDAQHVTTAAIERWMHAIERIDTAYRTSPANRQSERLIRHPGHL